MAPADAAGAIFVLVQRHGQTHGEKSLVRFSRSAKTIAACVPEETCQTDQTFPTETEAKQFAKEMLTNKYRIVAGTLLSADQPARRIISGPQLYRWIEEEEG